MTGSASSLTHATNLTVSVTGGNIGTTSTRTKYVRTDAATEYYLWVNTHWVVYDAPRSHFFVTDPFSNQVFVLDAKTESSIATIEVPGAYGIDESPDNTKLFVGTLLGDVYVIDPATMKVSRRYIASEIGPYGYAASTALALADGRLALLGEEGGIPSVDGSSNIAVWNPADNSITIYGGTSLSTVPWTPLCGGGGGHLFGFALTADRRAVLVGSGGICRVNATTGESLLATSAGNPMAIVVSPDGRYIALPSSNAVVLIDQQTLTQVAQFDVSGDVSSAANLFFSADSKTLYVNGPGILYAYDVSTHKQAGWLPNIVVTYTQGGFAVGPPYSPIMGASDNSGLVVGPLEQGFGFLDMAQLRTGPVGTTFLNAYLDPATGPVSGGTMTQWSAPASVNAQSHIFFGGNPATGISSNGSFVSVKTPAGAPGPADVYVFTSDGGMELVPEGFSFGPSILQVTTNLSTAEGGGVGAVYGYGFVPIGVGTVPPDLSVAVGGQRATILGFNPNAYNVSSQPFLLQALYFTIPAGSENRATDVSVTTSAGTATAKGALTYLPQLKQFPLSGSSLAEGIYDPIRDVYYFTDANKIQVFSLAQSKWLNPISITPPTGTSPRLWGISLSPNGSKLAVADAGGGVVYVVDPANPTSVKTVPIFPSVPTGVTVSPAGVAITDSGVAYLTVDVQGGTGFHNFYILNTNNGALTDLGIDGPGLGSSDLYLKTAVSADNSRAYFNDDGFVFSIDTVTGTMFQASANQGCCYGDYDVTLSPNQVQFESSSYLYDSDLNARSFLTANDREIDDIQYVYGTKFSPDGSLLFQPAAQGIDVFDGRVGRLLSRIALPVALSQNYDALVSNGHDNVLIAITGATGNGIAVVDLTTLREPAPLPNSFPSRINSSTSESRTDSSADVQRGRPLGARPRRIPHLTSSGLLSH